MSLDLSGPEVLHKEAVDAYDKFWESVKGANFTYFKRLKFGMVNFILYAPDSAFREYHKQVFGDDPGNDGPGIAVFAGSQSWTKEEFLLKGQLYIMTPVTLVNGKVLMHENALRHEILHLADWYSEMVDGADFAEPDNLNNASFYKEK